MPATPPTPGQGFHSRVASLDGLRGIAILLVLCWHFLPHYLLFPGWVGVDLFFVLSGYLITGRLLAAKGKPNFLSHFYRNRLLRIAPLYYALLITFLLFIRFVVSAKNLPLFEGYMLHWKSFFIFTQNWTIIQHPFPNPHDLSLEPLWSVAVEMQFYLIWPFIILLTPSPKSRLIVFQILLAAVITFRIYYTLSFPDRIGLIYYNSFFRMDSFLIGSFLCQLHNAAPQKRIPHTRWLLSILAPIFLILIFAIIAAHDAGPGNSFFPLGGYTLLAFFFGTLLHAALQPGNHLPVLQNKFLVLCGRTSFCLYIIHFPVLSILSPRLYALTYTIWPGYETLANLITALCTFLLSFAISLLSYRYFESFFLRLKT